MHNKQKTALIAPLNWGLGHASRMIPVIRCLQNDGYTVTVAAGPPVDEMIRLEFPGLRILSIKSYNIRYARSRLLMLKLILQVPGMIRDLIYERKWIKKYVREEAPDLIISDNRFGLYSQDVTSYYMTHQVNVIMPLYLKPFQPLARFMHRCLIKKYDACLIPDFDDDGGLSGKLAHKPGGFKFLHKYTGPLSGFSEIEPKSFENIPDVLAVVSGPEPQRTIFIKRLVDVFSNDKRQVWIVAGQPECDYDHIDEHIRIINHLKRSELKYLMGHVPVLIARSGYTTLMDLHVLKRKAILIPTPGQTEQEYLAGYFQKRFNFKVIDQKKIHASELFKPDHCGEWPHHRNQKSCNISGIFTS